MKSFIWAVLAVFFVFLTGCGGGGGGSETNASANIISQAEIDNAKAVLSVNAEKATLVPATVGEYFVHLSNGSREVFVKKTQVMKVFFNNAAVGFHSVDQTKGVELTFDPSNPTLAIAGQPFGAFGGMYTFLLNDGQELSLNTEAKWLQIVVSDGMKVEVGSDGLIYGTLNVPPPVEQKTLIEINTTTGQIYITPVVVDKQLLGLVNSNPSETVLDANNQIISGYRIAWNDNGNWYPAGGKVAALTLPKTSLANASRQLGSGAGMPYLVRPDGTFVPFNTSPETSKFVLNGAWTKINVDGLFYY